MGKSIVKNRMMKSRGFSLLEIIIALTIIGIVLVSLATYARKKIDEHVRQVDAEAIAEEVYGVLQFVNADTIEIFGSKIPGGSSAPDKRIARKVTNPLYQLPGMVVFPDGSDNKKGLEANPIWLAHSHKDISLDGDATKPDSSPYIARNYSNRVTDPISNDINIIDGGHDHYSHSLKWSQAFWGQNSVRNYFTDSGCPENTGTGDAVYFKQQFLSCSENAALKNSEIAVSRIDLVNDKGSYPRTPGAGDRPVPVDRVDVYVSFTPTDGNPARLEQFITPLMTAFRAKKIAPDANNIYLVRSLTGKNNNDWTLLNKTTGMPAGNNASVRDLATFTDLPGMVGQLQKDRIYALRFTFDGKGDYLRTDGLSAATKVCWNTTSGSAGPCLTSSSPDALVLKRRDNPQEFANIQVNSVISKASYIDGDGGHPEYNTSPQIQYKTFGQSGTMVGPFYKKLVTENGKEVSKLCSHTDVDNCVDPGVSVATPRKIADTRHGAISVPVQVCPVTEDGNHLNPRLSVSVSSVVSGIKKLNNGVPDTSMNDVFNSQQSAIEFLDKRNISINRLGGTVLQVYKCDPSDPDYNGQPCNGKNEWKIASVVATEDMSDKGKAWQYYNPPWLSVMITTWCSSVTQP